MSQEKPYIALVPGAWHSPVHYQELLNLFEKAGYPTKSIQLPSVGSADPNKESVAGDAAAIRENLLLPLIDNGKDVVLVMHSYGGCPGAAAAKGLSKVERKNNGVIGLVFVAAFLAREGDSLLSALGGKFDPWVIINVSTILYGVQFFSIFIFTFSYRDHSPANLNSLSRRKPAN